MKPDHLDAMLELARLEETAGRGGEALRWLDKAASLNGKDVRPRLARHGLHLRAGQAKQALDAAREAQAIAPDHPATLMALADAQVAIGNPDLARVTLRRMLQGAAFNASWLTQAAARQMQIGDTEAAAYILNKALLAEPAHVPARVLQARLSLQQGKFADAEKQVQSLLQAPTLKAEALSVLGELRLAQKRPAEAVEAYRSAYQAKSDRTSLFGLYGALMTAKQPREAARLMEDWQTRHPADRMATHALGEARLALDDWSRARTVYQALLKLHPDDARAHNNLAHALMRLGDKAALDHAERARALAPNQPQVNDTLGWILVQQGQVEKGLRYLREAALRAPDDPAIRAHLDEALARLRSLPGPRSPWPALPRRRPGPSTATTAPIPRAG